MQITWQRPDLTIGPGVVFAVVSGLGGVVTVYIRASSSHEPHPEGLPSSVNYIPDRSKHTSDLPHRRLYNGVSVKIAPLAA